MVMALVSHVRNFPLMEHAKNAPHQKRGPLTQNMTAQIVLNVASNAAFAKYLEIYIANHAPSVVKTTQVAAIAHPIKQTLMASVIQLPFCLINNVVLHKEDTSVCKHT